MDINRRKKELILRCIKRDPDYYSQLSEEIKNNQEISLCAIKNDIYNFNYLPKEYKKNKPFLLSLLEINPMVYHFFDNSEKNDTSIMIEFSSRYADKAWVNKRDKLRFYRELSTDIIEEETLFTSEKLWASHLPTKFNKNKKAICKLAAKLNTKSFLHQLYIFIDTELKNDKEFIQNLVKANYEIYSFIRPSFQDEPEILETVMKTSSGRVFKSFHEDFRNDSYFVLLMIELGHINKQHLGNDLKREVGSNEIKEYLNAKILREKMDQELSQEKTNQKKLKI